MRGKNDRSEILFGYIRLDERIPADHPLRVIRQLVDAALAELSRAFTKLYARDGRPSIPAGTVVARVAAAGVLHGAFGTAIDGATQL
jgi:hypothetical protein